MPLSHHPCPPPPTTPSAESSVARLSRPSYGHPAEVPLRRQDFPKVEWWHRKDWRKHKKSQPTEFGKSKKRGGTRAANGENTRYGFIEDANGNPVDGFRAAAIRARFRVYAVYLYNRGRAPDTWARGIEPQDRLAFDSWMCATCPELRYCEGNWKAQEVGILE
ncbi:hypothetical protein OH77DRAFT_1432345 [Trametes cingulata]|nr:hypothetical protein OH77DRAFT_1432345 [Trametes cingulata]